jgi:putative membrane protein
LPNPVSYLTAGEAASLDTLVARVEARTGIQIVPAIVGKADTYAEVPWKAFAIGAAFSALALVVFDDLKPTWATASTAIMHAIVVLVAGGACALAAGFVPAIARLLVRDTHEIVEVRQYAESLFLRHTLFATRARTGVLVLVSLFERRIEIVADTGFNGRVSQADWQAVIGRMAPHLSGGRPFDALNDALGAIEELLTARGFQGSGGADELPNTAIQERGA